MVPTLLDEKNKYGDRTLRTDGIIFKGVDND